jgi:hypothetical protein
VTDEPAGILGDGITRPTMDTIRRLRASDHARAAEIIKSLDEAARDPVCSDLVDIYVPMVGRAERDGLGWSTDEIHETFPRLVARMSGDEFILTPEQVYEVCAAWFAGQPDLASRITRPSVSRRVPG